MKKALIIIELAILIYLVFAVGAIVGYLGNLNCMDTYKLKEIISNQNYTIEGKDEIIGSLEDEIIQLNNDYFGI